MKKFLALFFCIFVLLGGLIACTEEEPYDEHKGLYGTYKMVSFEKGGVEVLFKGNRRETNSHAGVTFYSNEVNDQLNSFINEVISKAGDTIAIYKNKKVKFTGGSMEEEFEYRYTVPSRIIFEEASPEDEFPFYFVRFEVFNSRTPPIFQLETRESIRINEELYEISFFYKEKDKF